MAAVKRVYLAHIRHSTNSVVVLAVYSTPEQATAWIRDIAKEHGTSVYYPTETSRIFASVAHPTQNRSWWVECHNVQ